MKLNKENDEVFRSGGPLTMVTDEDIRFLKERAAKNERRRVRLCAHPGDSDRLHEMLIVHMKDAYVPPHKHVNKSESFHMVEGRLTVFIFDDDGRVTETISMGEVGSGRVFFYRLSSSLYHSVLPESDFVVFHETTNGPFDRRDMIVAPWAPAEGDGEAEAHFRRSLSNIVGRGGVHG